MEFISTGTIFYLNAVKLTKFLTNVQHSVVQLFCDTNTIFLCFIQSTMNNQQISGNQLTTSFSPAALFTLLLFIPVHLSLYQKSTKPVQQFRREKITNKLTLAGHLLGRFKMPNDLIKVTETSWKPRSTEQVAVQQWTSLD